MPAIVLSECVPTVIVDPYGDVCTLNAEAEKLLGESTLNMVDKPWNRPLIDGSVINLDGRIIQLAIIKTTLASYVMLNDVSVKERFGQQTSGPATDIETLQSDLKKAQELLAVKEKFTSLIAHDFGTPITSIRLQSDLLKMHFNSLPYEAVTQRLEQIDGQLNHMIDLLDDLLLLNQIHGPQGGESPAFHLEVFCRKIVDQIKRSWKGRQVIVTYAGQMDNIQVDRRVIRYVLSNLVGNALKYSPKGGDVNVDINVTDETITLSVKDQGIGIPVDEVGKIFTQFYRASNVNEVSGLGLGLTMMRTCIEMCDGTISVESKLDEGSTFVVCLPRNDGHYR